MQRVDTVQTNNARQGNARKVTVAAETRVACASVNSARAWVYTFFVGAEAVAEPSSISEILRLFADIDVFDFRLGFRSRLAECRTRDLGHVQIVQNVDVK